MKAATMATTTGVIKVSPLTKRANDTNLFDRSNRATNRLTTIPMRTIGDSMILKEQSQLKLGGTWFSPNATTPRQTGALRLRPNKNREYDKYKASVLANRWRTARLKNHISVSQGLLKLFSSRPLPRVEVSVSASVTPAASRRAIRSPSAALDSHAPSNARKLCSYQTTVAGETFLKYVRSRMNRSVSCMAPSSKAKGQCSEVLGKQSV